MSPQLLLPGVADLALLTDLYELTMAAGYFARGMHERPAAFELFVRRLPEHRAFLLVAGLEQFVEYVTNLRFDAEAIATIRGLPIFECVPAAFFEYLRGFRFRGDIHAMPEGTVAFANEPIVRVTGGLLETQILETIALAAISSATLLASKAARVVIAARGRPVIDFGARRAHGLQAGLIAARAALIAGCATTSNVRAATLFGTQPAGTMAHSWISSFASEAAAFEAFGKIFPAGITALVDTYEIEQGVRNAARLGARLAAIRIDSGELGAEARRARRILDEAGCGHTKIILSGDLNEHSIAQLLAEGVPVDVFGVGTEMVTSRDAPSLSAVYKLVASADDAGVVRPRAKRSAGKISVGGVKQVRRTVSAGGEMLQDVICLDDEQIGGDALLRPVIQGGELNVALPTLEAIRQHATRQITALPSRLRELNGPCDYAVKWSPRLSAS